MMTEAVRLRFVGRAAAARGNMLSAHRLCEQYRTNGMLATWVTEKDCLQITDITKKDVFVLEEFSGPVFNKLINTKALIVGPRCLSCCLTEGSEIPPGPHPVFTIAMRNLVITISGMETEQKTKLSTKILWMGGRYENVLTEETTHLISATVLSEKYIKSKQYGIKVMNADWVEAVWNESIEQNVLASDSHFDKYGLSVFHGIIMTASGLSKREKKELSSLVHANGGIVKGEFVSEEINVVVLNSDGVGSEKYKAAQVYRVACVFPSWIHESIKHGYALNVKDFTVQNKTSSPNRSQSQIPPMSLDFSTISHLRDTTTNLRSDDTCSTISNDTATNSVRSQKTQSRLCGITKELAQLVDSIDMKQVKQAGLFLDGCGIYVYGLTSTRKEKLHRIISRAGAVRYDRPTEAVTHAVCGDPSATPAEMKQTCMSRAKHVTVRWLTDSMYAGRTLDETAYLALPSEKNDNTLRKEGSSMQSPMSKRNIQLLRTPVRLPPVPLFGDDDDKDDYKDEIIQQYLPGNSIMNEPEDTLVQFMQHENITNNDAKNTDVSNDKTTKVNNDNISMTKNSQKKNDSNKSDNKTSMQSSLDTSQVLVYEGITFEIQDIDEEAEQIGQRIEKAGGILVDKEGSYIVVPMNCDKINITNKNSEVVTSTWLDDCLLREQIVPIDYYHRPVKLDSNSKPLEGLVFSLSTYSGIERAFIMEISGLLGALVQTSLYRRSSPAGERSTHLICPDPVGAKYNGAMAWGLPVVPSQWLLDCAAANKHIDEAPYLVGAEPDTIVDESVKSQTTVSNKENEMSEKSMQFPPNVTNRKSNETVEEVKIDTKIKNSTPQQILNRSSSDNTPNRAHTRLSTAAEMSPASRYIAMARQGLLGLESQETPKRIAEENLEQTRKVDDTVSTPPMDNALSTPNLALFSTPSRRRIQAIKRGERPSNPLTTPKNPFNISAATPDSPFGAMLRPETGRMSPESRKKCWKFCDNLPSPTVKASDEKDATPMSDLKRKFFSECMNRDKTSSNLKKFSMGETETPPAKQRKISSEAMSLSTASPNPGLDNQLKLLNSVLTGGETMNGSNTLRSFKGKRSISSPAQKSKCIENIDMAVQLTNVESQLDTVGWDDMSESPLPVATDVDTPCSVEPPKQYIFTLSQNVDNCDEIKKIIERLGGSVLESNELDLRTTHLLSSYLTRSEKFLGCLASGKWILHPSYVVRSQEAGRFIDEENFEWGNPKASQIKIDSNEQQMARAVYRWRSRQSESKPLPFAEFRVIMYIQEARKGPLMRVLRAGGGEVVDVSPPFSGDIDATHCLMEQRRMALSPADMKYLTSRNIPICPPILLNSILTDDPSPKSIGPT